MRGRKKVGEVPQAAAGRRPRWEGCSAARHGPGLWRRCPPRARTGGGTGRAAGGGAAGSAAERCERRPRREPPAGGAAPPPPRSAPLAARRGGKAPGGREGGGAPEPRGGGGRDGIGPATCLSDSRRHRRRRGESVGSESRRPGGCRGQRVSRGDKGAAGGMARSRYRPSVPRGQRLTCRRERGRGEPGAAGHRSPLRAAGRWACGSRCPGWGEVSARSLIFNPARITGIVPGAASPAAGKQKG